MSSVILTFMKALEAAIPPPLNCHHALMYSQYGSDTTGWEDKLTLQVNVDGVFTSFFLDESELHHPAATIDMLVKQLHALNFKPQIGVALGQHIKAIRPLDGKFHIENNQIVKTSNGEIVPLEEPLMLFRGRDYLAYPTIQHYLRLCIADGCTDFQIVGINLCLVAFHEFSIKNIRTMKQPGITKGL